MLYIDRNPQGHRARRVAMLVAGALCAALLTACGGGGGGGGSSPATGVAPMLTAQPQSQRIPDGQTATFSVSAASATTIGYQWSRNGAAIAGATSASYSIATARLSDDGAAFTVTVSNAFGSVQSAAATLNVTAVAPTLANSAPTTLTVAVGQPATFAVTASGSLPLTFQWRRGGVAIAGATASAYTIPVTVLADSGATFDVVVSNVAGSVTSALFTLNVTSVTQPASITTQPQSVSVIAGQPASFSVTASGTAPFTYQWQRNGTAIAGAQSATYTLTSTSSSDSGAQFSVVVGNVAGSVTSADATLTVAAQQSLSLVAGHIGGQGTIDGNGTAARFVSPSAIAVDNAGNAFVADASTVRELSASGVVTTFAGSPTATGSADGPGATARFGSVAGTAVDAGGNVFVSDRSNHTIRKITAAGVVSTFAGTSGTPGSADGIGTAATFNNPGGVAVDAAGNVYVADSGNQTIRRISASGVVTTIAGSPGIVGSADGSGNAASFNGPLAVAVDASSNVYVTDSVNSTIRKITSAGAVSTFAGTAGNLGSSDGSGAAASFRSPVGIAVDAAGNVYVGDGFNRTIRMITPAGVVATIAGTPGGTGAADGTGAAAAFSNVTGLAVSAAGDLLVGDRDNFEIRSITTAGVVTTVAGAAQVSGGADGTGSAASFAQPYGVVSDPNGNLYVADPGNNTVRRIAAGGVVTTLAGTAGSAGIADGFGAAARFGAIRGIAIGASGNLYVADFTSNTVRMITPAGNVTTFVGNPSIGGSSDGTGNAATFSGPGGIAVDATGNLFVTDSLNATIRKVTPTGVVTTFAGTAGLAGSADGTGAAASFNLPTGITIDGAGNLYVVDTGNDTIRKVTAAGVVTTIAGMPGIVGSADGAGPVASFNAPVAIASDLRGNLFVADSGNRTVRRIDSAGNVTTPIGTADGRRGTRLGSLPGALTQPLGLAVDGAANLYVTDSNAVLTVAP